MKNALVAGRGVSFHHVIGNCLKQHTSTHFFHQLRDFSIDRLDCMVCVCVFCHLFQLLCRHEHRSVFFSFEFNFHAFLASTCSSIFIFAFFHVSLGRSALYVKPRSSTFSIWAPRSVIFVLGKYPCVSCGLCLLFCLSVRTQDWHN